MSVYQSQKTTKPKPKDVAGDFLAAERVASMLNFVDFAQANKIGIRWDSGNSWELKYKSKQLGFLKIYYYDIQSGCERLFGKSPLHRSWFFCHNGNYLEHYYSMEDCDLKTFIFDNIYASNCGHCFCSWHLKGINKLNEQKAGYMNPTGCRCWPLRIYNPNGKVLEQTKQLVEYRMNCILEESKR